MKTVILTWSERDGWKQQADPSQAQLVIYFGAPLALARQDVFGQLRKTCPSAHLVGCSTGGEILGADVNDGTVVAVAVRFDSATVKVASLSIQEPSGSRAVGVALAQQFPPIGLRGVFVLADGMRTNGTALVGGLREVLDPSVLLTGGLAGDGADFKKTLVGADAPASEGMVAAIGFYGESLRLGWGSFGGWERFGPERIITRSEANILYELDGEPALDLYKRYLGDEAANLPGSALLFPLTVRRADEEKNALVRTIVGIDAEARSMTFAGDVPMGHVAQLMRGHFDELVDGASKAGEQAAQPDGDSLALLVSCIGRKLLMGQRIGDEAEAVAEALGKRTAVLGFYSYGEIAPHPVSGRCELHNQTMTVTSLSEA